MTHTPVIATCCCGTAPEWMYTDEGTLIRRGTADEQVNLFNSRVKTLIMTRQSRRGEGIPLKNLRRGASDTARMKGQEYPALLLACMVALGDDERFFDAETLKEVQWALSLLYVFWMLLKLEKIEPGNASKRRVENLASRFEWRDSTRSSIFEASINLWMGPL